MSIDFGADLTGVGNIMGRMSAVAETVKTKAYVSDLVKYSWRYLAREFNAHMHALSASNPSAYHHVYEWGKVGEPGAQLWSNVLKGSGGNRTATFNFLPSVDPVPRQSDYAGYKPYVFWNKAMVMEYGIPVKVQPKGANGKLAMEFPNGEVKFTNNPVLIEHPGGNVMGNFTGAYAEWWGEVAPKVFESNLKPRYEENISKVTTARGAQASSVRIGGRATQKSFDLGFSTGYAAAGKELIETAAKYNQYFSDDYENKFAEVFE